MNSVKRGSCLWVNIYQPRPSVAGLIQTLERKTVGFTVSASSPPRENFYSLVDRELLTGEGVFFGKRVWNLCSCLGQS